MNKSVNVILQLKANLS